jgi:hypothetical protein
MGAIDASALHGDAATGELERLLPIDAWQHPGHVELRGDRLVWRWRRPKWVIAKRGLLREFLALADAQDVLRFAQKWGVLVLCRCELFSGHRVMGRPLPRTGYFDGCVLRRVDRHRNEPLEYWEPVSTWLRYARGAMALLRLTEEIRNGRRGSSEDWGALSPKLPSPPRTLVEGRLFVSSSLETWLHWSGAQVNVVWNGSGPNLAIGRRRLSAALAVQLASAATQGTGFAFCSACGVTYQPHRRPSIGRRNYCPTCRRSGQPVRDASRDYQRRRTAKRAAR